MENESGVKKKKLNWGGILGKKRNTNEKNEYYKSYLSDVKQDKDVRRPSFILNMMSNNVLQGEKMKQEFDVISEKEENSNSLESLQEVSDENSIESEPMKNKWNAVVVKENMDNDVTR